MKALRLIPFAATFVLAFHFTRVPAARADETWVGVSLHPAGATSSEARVVSTAGQFGSAMIGGLSNAAGWNGTALGFTNLAPAGSTDSAALGASGDLQGGYGIFSGTTFAGIWSGTAASFGLLHPTGTGSRINAISGSQQAGGIFVGSFPLTFVHAALWNGSVLNYVDLHPAAATYSEVFATNGTRQVGVAVATFQRAVLWNGTNTSIIDLHPANATSSIAYGIDATKQVGEATFSGNAQPGSGSGMPSSPTCIRPATSILPSGRRTETARPDR